MPRAQRELLFTQNDMLGNPLTAQHTGSVRAPHFCPGGLRIGNFLLGSSRVSSIGWASDAVTRH